MKIEGRNPVRETILAGTHIAKLFASNNCKDKVFNDIILSKLRVFLICFLFLLKNIRK